MKKSDLKTGMLIETRGRGLFLFINSICVSQDNFYIPDLNRNLTDNDGKEYDFMRISKVLIERSLCPDKWTEETLDNNILWERKEKIYKIDGVEYSKSTLRSLIKKATD